MQCSCGQTITPHRHPDNHIWMAGDGTTCVGSHWHMPIEEEFWKSADGIVSVCCASEIYFHDWWHCGSCGRFITDPKDQVNEYCEHLEEQVKKLNASLDQVQPPVDLRSERQRFFLLGVITVAIFFVISLGIVLTIGKS